MHARGERIGQDHVAIEAAADAVLAAGIEHEVSAHAGAAGHDQKAVHRLHSLQGEGSTRPKWLFVQYNMHAPPPATPTASRSAEFMLIRDPTLGVLLVGHGTASEVGTRQFLALGAATAGELRPTACRASVPGNCSSRTIAEGVRRLDAARSRTDCRHAVTAIRGRPRQAGYSGRCGVRHSAEALGQRQLVGFRPSTSAATRRL